MKIVVPVWASSQRYECQQSRIFSLTPRVKHITIFAMVDILAAYKNLRNWKWCWKYRPLCAWAADCGMNAMLDARRWDIRSPRQIDHLTVIPKEIKFSLPVIPHDKFVDMVLPDIPDLLFPVGFRNHQINIPAGLNYGFPFIIRKKWVLVLAGIELICWQGNYQVVSKGPCPSEQIYMAYMKKIKSSVGNNLKETLNN